MTVTVTVTVTVGRAGFFASEPDLQEAALAGYAGTRNCRGEWILGKAKLWDQLHQIAGLLVDLPGTLIDLTDLLG